MEFPFKKCDYEWYFYRNYYHGSKREKWGIKTSRSLSKAGRDILIPYSLLQSSLLWPRKYIQKGAHTFKNIKEVLKLLNKNDILYKKV